MNLPHYTEQDLARLALSTRLRDLSDELRKAVAEPDEAGTSSEPGSTLSERIWQLLNSDVPVLQDELVAYLRTRGTSWTWIGERTGLSAQDAEERWGLREPEHLADPRARAAALDEWYVRHVQMEPLANFAAPVSRLLRNSTPLEERCLICEKYAGEPVPAWAGRPVPPGGHLVDDGTWRACHGPTSYWPRGTLLIESHRHFVDHSDLTEEEAASHALLVRRLTTAVKQATGSPRVYTFSSMEGTPHFHTWLMPRIGEDGPRGRPLIGNPGHCAEAEAVETVHAIRKALGDLAQPEVAP
ncbi:HIT family protein [Streptomyces sp. YGL11-2]|uniref:HIT family protein n=1 Tax=Streptomyces sp. YGL11-2 TaxID=3414028 RepID=UPI003CE6C12D